MRFWSERIGGSTVLASGGMNGTNAAMLYRRSQKAFLFSHIDGKGRRARTINL
jgi:hypothetical protein